MNITNAGVRGYNPTGVVIHNDAGSNGANTGFYNNWQPFEAAYIWKRINQKVKYNGNKNDFNNYLNFSDFVRYMG